jgi:hypothetical protein
MPNPIDQFHIASVAWRARQTRSRLQERGDYRGQFIGDTYAAHRRTRQWKRDGTWEKYCAKHTASPEPEPLTEEDAAFANMDRALAADQEVVPATSGVAGINVTPEAERPLAEALKQVQRKERLQYAKIARLEAAVAALQRRFDGNALKLARRSKRAHTEDDDDEVLSVDPSYRRNTSASNYLNSSSKN